MQITYKGKRKEKIINKLAKNNDSNNLLKEIANLIEIDENMSNIRELVEEEYKKHVIKQKKD